MAQPYEFRGNAYRKLAALNTWTKQRLNPSCRSDGDTRTGAAHRYRTLRPEIIYCGFRPISGSSLRNISNSAFHLAA
jgi:hypothetical protein